jgi:hypothetical protein
MKQRQFPSPVTKPAVTKSPPMLFVVKPLSSCPAESSSSIPSMEVVLEPKSRRILAPARASIAAHVTVTEPTKERVAEPAMSWSTSAAWKTPQLLVMPALRMNYGNVPEDHKRNTLRKPERLCLDIRDMYHRK